MAATTRLRILKLVLILTGLVFIFGLYPLMSNFTSWNWQPAQPEYEQMFMVVYATLGIFLLIAAKNPLEHRSLIAFAGWSSIAHGGIMAWQAYKDPVEQSNFYGDVPALIIVGLLLVLLMPRKAN